MGPILSSKAWKRVAMVMVEVAVMAIVGCQLHTASHDQIQASTAGHQHTPAPHATSALTCLMATLPPMVSLAPVDLCTPYTTTRMAHPTEFALPPFIPPEEVRPA